MCSAGWENFLTRPTCPQWGNPHSCQRSSRCLNSSVAAGCWVDEICPEMLKALDTFGCLEGNICSVCRGSLQQCLWNGDSHFQKRGPGGCAPIIGVTYCSPSTRKLFPGCWKEGLTEDGGGAMRIPSCPWNSESALYPHRVVWGGNGSLTI